MRWILDDGPFGELADLRPAHFVEACPADSLWIAPATAKAVAASSKRADLLELARSQRPLVGVLRIMFGAQDPASDALKELHGDEDSRANLAEREAIAWASVHSVDSIFVTSDRRAALTALAELGRGRVAHPFDLWLKLLEQQALDRSAFRRLCDRTRARDQGLERMPKRVRALFSSDD